VPDHEPDGTEGETPPLRAGQDRVGAGDADQVTVSICMAAETALSMPPTTKR
jgi:hypothetical protein